MPILQRTQLLRQQMYLIVNGTTSLRQIKPHQPKRQLMEWANFCLAVAPQSTTMHLQLSNSPLLLEQVNFDWNKFPPNYRFGRSSYSNHLLLHSATTPNLAASLLQQEWVVRATKNFVQDTRQLKTWHTMLWPQQWCAAQRLPTELRATSIRKTNRANPLVQTMLIVESGDIQAKLMLESGPRWKSTFVEMLFPLGSPMNLRTTCSVPGLA